MAKKYSFITSKILVMDDSGTKATCRQKADLTPKGIGKNVTIHKRGNTVDTENLQMLVPVEDFEHIWIFDALPFCVTQWQLTAGVICRQPARCCQVITSRRAIAKYITKGYCQVITSNMTIAKYFI